MSLLPRGATELSHDCSCLDWPGPCRHVSALLYVLVEAVDENPLLLLTLRGLSLEDLVAPVADTPSDDGDDTGDVAAPPAPFDPARTDPARLAEVVGDEVAAIIHRFYTGPS